MSLFPFFKRPAARTGAVAALALAGSGFLQGCDLVNQIQANEFAVGVLVQSPPAKDPTDPNGVKTLPQVTSFNLFFADVDKSKVTGNTASADAVSPLAGATVTLQYHDTKQNKDVSIPVADKGSGKYSVDSTNSQLGYFAQQQYALNISWSGKSYKMTVTAPNAVKIKEFESQPVQREYPTGQSFTVTRDPSTDTNVAFVEVASIGSGGNVNQVYTNAPQDPLGFLQLILNPSQWETPSFTIPGDKFSASTTPYLVSLSSVAQGSVATDAGLTDLFVGSTFLAGVADGGVLVTK